MERCADLAIILKTYPYDERDRIATCLTENYGRVTGLAKGAISSRRYGGSLDFLACSRVELVQKPHAEMARIDSATSHRAFERVHGDFARLTAASFAAEFCLRLLEPRSPAREMFVILSNLLFHMDEGMAPELATNAFLCKSFRALGYAPSLLRCAQCSKPAHVVMEDESAARDAGSLEATLFYWSSEAGGMICRDCDAGRAKPALGTETLLHFHRLTVSPFKELAADAGLAAPASIELNRRLYRLLAEFLHDQLPGLPSAGFKSWALLNETLDLHA